MGVNGEEDVGTTSTTIADYSTDDTDTSGQKSRKRPAHHSIDKRDGGGCSSGGNKEETVGDGDDEGPSENGEKRKRKRNRTRKKKAQQKEQQQEPGCSAVGEHEEDLGAATAFATGITDTIYVRSLTVE